MHVIIKFITLLSDNYISMISMLYVLAKEKQKLMFLNISKILT